MWLWRPPALIFLDLSDNQIFKHALMEIKHRDPRHNRISRDKWGRFRQRSFCDYPIGTGKIRSQTNQQLFRFGRNAVLHDTGTETLE
jgi:hypothetical protein